MRPLCFVLMPFGRKLDASGRTVDFDAVYADLIAPAIALSGLEPLRADEEFAGGIIHKPMFERLVLCDYAVADLTGANANVFYELGVRHAVRPHTSVLLFAEGAPLPFDVGLLRALPYRLGPDGRPLDPAASVAALAARLSAAREPVADSPLYQLLTDYPHVGHEKTDVFRERAAYSNTVKRRLAQARRQGPAAVRVAEAALDAEYRARGGAGIRDAEAGVLVDLMLCWRAVEDWGEMIGLVERFPRPLQASALVREQHAFALNRAGRAQEAESILLDLIAAQGPASERCGLLGRIYKDQWQAAREAGRTVVAGALLDKAISAYRQGFETDWRDAYPGINAVTLMECRQPPDAERFSMLPVVRYAALRRAEGPHADYWDFVTLFEAAVLGEDRDGALHWIGQSLAAVREAWEPKTTLRNLRLVIEARTGRGIDCAWLAPFIGELEAALAAPAVHEKRSREACAGR